MIQLFGSPRSTCTRKVLTVLVETNTPYEITLVDLGKGEHKGAAHLARQPFGQIPVMDDDGFRLFESRAIGRYIDEKSGGPLTPKTLRQRALMNQWQSVEQSNFSPAMLKFVFHYAFNRPQEQAVLDAAQKMMETTLGAISTSLAESPYLSGDQFTLADVGYMPYLEYTMNTPLRATFEKFPHVMSWWNRISERPSWRKVAER